MSEALDLFPCDTFDQGLFSVALELLGDMVPVMHHLWDRPIGVIASATKAYLNRTNKRYANYSCGKWG
jgi:hypothetical protein